MATAHPLGFAPGNVYLEAEINKNAQHDFSKRYLAATHDFVCPGDPPAYQDQPNKWSAELRIYFNADQAAISRLTARSYQVAATEGYRGEYAYRINNNDLWWELVEKYGFRLGAN